MITRYTMPQDWIRYDTTAILHELMGAKATMLALKQIPYQRSWAEELQKIQLKREVAGTSRIEGAEFTDKELDAAMRATPVQLETRSQWQARAPSPWQIFPERPDNSTRSEIQARRSFATCII